MPVMAPVLPVEPSVASGGPKPVLGVVGAVAPVARRFPVVGPKSLHCPELNVLAI